MKEWFAKHDRLVVSSLFIAIVSFAGVSLFLGITPYLGMVDNLDLELDNMVIVSREYPFVTENTVSENETAIILQHPIQSVKGIYLQNEYDKSTRVNYLHNHTVLLDEKTLDLSSNPAELILPDKETPVVVEYYRHNWSSVIWALDLRINNTSGGMMRVPAANVSVGDLGSGWIPHSTDIPKGKIGIVRGFLKVNNDRYFHDFLTAILYGLPFDLSAELEAYAMIDYAWIKVPCFGLKINLPFDFPIDAPSSSGQGNPPQMFNISRSSITANSPVFVNVTAKDKGAGISNRTYVRASTDNGISWYNYTLTGPAWDNQTETGAGLGGIFPYNSTRSPQLYQGSIPGFPATTRVLWKVYLEDYAGNIDHLKPANWVESQVFEYTIPTTGSLPEEVTKIESELTNPSQTPQAAQESGQENQEVDDRDFGTKIFDYIESNGVPLMYFLKQSGVDLGVVIEEKLDDIIGFLYTNNVDSNYFIGTLLSSFDMSINLIADSGLSIGHLVGVLGLNIPSFFKFAVDNLFMPTVGEIKDYGKKMFEGIQIVDDMDSNILSRWTHDSSGTLSVSTNTRLNVNGANVGVASLNWDITASGAKIQSNLGSSLQASQNDALSFWLTYFPLGFATLNQKLLLKLTDGASNIISTDGLELVQIDTLGEWQEISVYLNTTSFPSASGFNWNDIKTIALEYSGSGLQSLYIDYFSTFKPKNYEQNVYFNEAIKLSNHDIVNTLKAEFTDITAIVFPSESPLVEENGSAFVSDWGVNSNRTPYYNFLYLLSTETGNFNGTQNTNYHINGAVLILRDAGSIAPYETMLAMIGASYYEGHLEAPVSDAAFYRYVNSFFLFLIGVPLLHNIIRIIKPKKRKGG